MKISRVEFVSILLAVAFLAFTAGWFVRGNSAQRPVWVETERTLVQQTPLLLPAPSTTPAQKVSPGGQKVNLNTADLEGLMSLPGIGEKRAGDIIAYREANGPFRMVEQITDVPGIGEGILNGLIDCVTVE